VHARPHILGQLTHQALAKAGHDLGMERSLRSHIDQGAKEELDAGVFEETAFDDRFVLNPPERADSIGQDVTLCEHQHNLAHRILHR
jgi:hypothetical protein